MYSIEVVMASLKRGKNKPADDYVSTASWVYVTVPQRLRDALHAPFD